jgi:hypothetical protein
LGVGGETPAPKDGDADEDDHPLKGSNDIPVMLGVPVGNRAEIPEVTEGKEVPVGIFGMDGQVLEGMQEHAEGKIEPALKLREKANERQAQGQGDGMAPIHPQLPEVVLVHVTRGDANMAVVIMVDVSSFAPENPLPLRERAG